MLAPVNATTRESGKFLLRTVTAIRRNMSFVNTFFREFAAENVPSDAVDWKAR